LVQSFVEALKNCGFEGNQVDPYLKIFCLKIKARCTGIIFNSIYVNDCIIIGADEAIDDFIGSLKGDGFRLNVENQLPDYLCCKIVQDFEKGRACKLQTHSVHHLTEISVVEVQGV
jgi:hypothetical protein